MNSPGSDDPALENGLQIYALLNLQENPRKLISKENKKSFFCHFALPLPQQVVVFAVGEWESSCTGISVEVSLDTELQPKKIGSLSKDNRAICWQSDWGKMFRKKSLELLQEDRMAKLVVSIETKSDSKKQNKTTRKSPFSPIQNLLKNDIQEISKTSATKNNAASKILSPKHTNTTLDDFWGAVDSNDTENSPESLQGTPPVSPSLNSRRKRTPRCTKENLPAGKRRKSLHNSEFSSPVSSLNSPRRNNVLNSPTVSSPPSTPCTPSVSKVGAPTGRWGHAMCKIDNNRTILIGGQGSKQQMVKDSLWVLRTGTGEVEWNQPSSTGGTGADRRMGHSICYDPHSKAVYVYGGSKNKRWYSDVHKLDTETWTWSAVQTVGKAPTRAYHSCTLFLGELWVFGGVYPNPDLEPDGCSDDMFVINLKTKNWYTPIVGSTKPRPRSGHSACILADRLVIFGGWDAPTCYNDLFLLDLTIMEYTQPRVTGTAPSPRSWHSVVALPGNKMVIHGGYSGIEALADAFIFNLDSLTWTGIQTPENIYPRAGHTAIHFKPEKDENDNDHEIAIFGGGDNLGEYFNDFFTFYPKQITTR